MEIYVLKISDIVAEFNKEQLNTMLPAFRKDTHEKYGNQADRERSLGAGLLLAYCMKQKGVSLEETPLFSKKGKLYFPGADKFYVNLSHGGDYAVCAVDDEEIGADFECIRPYKEAAAKRICTLAEWEALQAMEDGQDRNRFFTRLWTRKESAAKYFGDGIAMLFEPDKLQKLCEKENVYTHTYERAGEAYLSVSSRKELFPAEIIVLSQESLLQ